MVEFPLWLRPPQYITRVNPNELFNSCKGLSLLSKTNGGYKRSELTFRKFKRVPAEYGTFWYWIYWVMGTKEIVWICDISDIAEKFNIQNEDESSYETSENCLVVRNQTRNDNANKIRSMGKYFDFLSKDKVQRKRTIVNREEKNLFTPTGDEKTVNVVFREK